MTRHLHSLILTVSTLATLGTACGDDSDSNVNAGRPGQEVSGVSCEGDLCILTGTLTEDVTLTADKQYLLRGGVFVGDDVGVTTLTIEPGVTIFGETSTQGMLVVRRNSRILAEGTKDAPIVMTSSKEEGARQRGDWGGLIINGNAPINACADSAEDGVCEGFGEGGTGFYGGDDPTDDSGVLRYVRIEFAGQLISPDNELNGLALQGVGSGTTLDFIQVHMAKDDGVEFFGGTADFKHIITTGIADDNLDWTDGWRGRGQYFIAFQYEDAGDNGIEADNNGEDNAITPRSAPVLSNLTLVGSKSSELSDIGVLLREGTGGEIHNAIITDWNDKCLDIDNLATFENVRSGELVMANTVLGPCGASFGDGEDAEDGFEGGLPLTVADFFNDGEGNIEADPLLTSIDTAAPDFCPDIDGPAGSGAVVPADPFFDQVTYKGAVDPNEDWTLGWTTSARN